MDSFPLKVLPLVLWVSLAFSLKADFDTLACLNASFETTISHRAFPFGLTKNKLHLKKDRCVLEVDHERLNFLRTRWLIDVCREPVHIKLGSSSVEVIRREGACPGEEEFCQEWERLKRIVEDHGLIFAEGRKEDINSDHGKTYCSYLLLEKYLIGGVVLGGRYPAGVNLFLRPNTPTMPEKKAPAPVATPPSAPTPTPPPAPPPPAPVPTS